MLGKWVKSFWWAIAGWKAVWREENNFRIEVIVGVFVIVSTIAFHFTYVESAFVVIAVILVLTGEIVNTAIEDVCNKIQPKKDMAIGKIKDMMAAFVLISSFGALVLGILTFAHHFLYL